MKKLRLYSPGPTPIPPDARQAMSADIDYHRSAEASEAVKECARLLKTAFQTASDVAVFASSGTGGMEAALVNCFSAGDPVLAVRSGKFGDRWVEIAQAYSLDVQPLEAEWGESVDPEAVEAALKARPETKGVLGTLCETSTGALHDIRALGGIARQRGVLLIVDAVSALGADEMRMDEWGVDALVSCSHKGLMTPPGVGLCALSERAAEASKSADLPRYYFDYAKNAARVANGSPPFTPAISLVYGLRASLETMMSAGGMEASWARHARLASAMRAAAEALNLRLFPRVPSNAVTAFLAPAGIDSQAFVANLRREHGAVFVGGQDALKGRLVRAAHLGWVDDFDIVSAAAALERGLADAGYRFSPGSGVEAAQRSLLNSGRGR